MVRRLGRAPSYLLRRLLFSLFGPSGMHKIRFHIMEGQGGEPHFLRRGREFYVTRGGQGTLRELDLSLRAVSGSKLPRLISWRVTSASTPVDGSAKKSTCPSTLMRPPPGYLSVGLAAVTGIAAALTTHPDILRTDLNIRQSNGIRCGVFPIGHVAIFDTQFIDLQRIHSE